MPPDQVNRALANRAENLFIATQAEADLVEAAHYDPAAFGELYRRYVVRVYRYLYSHVNDETFAFRLLEGSPFYLFRKDGQINAWYTAQIVPLGFEGVIHYACCSGGYLTLKGNDTMVWFYAFKDHVWYYVEIGVHS